MKSYFNWISGYRKPAYISIEAFHIAVYEKNKTINNKHLLTVAYQLHSMQLQKSEI